MTDLKQKIINAVQDDLTAIEMALENHLAPNFELVKQVAGHILFAGGKRLRPLLMILAARACGCQNGQEIDFSVIFEYLHAATLLHDDVVDSAILRRGQPTAHQIWGPSTAVLTGDFLLARSLEIAARTESLAVIRIIANITGQMAQAEIRQMANKGDISLSEADYLQVINDKTAVLFQGACQVGALMAGADNNHVKAFGDYGHHLGMAFQMADDLLDYTQDSAILGKKVGADLREGKLTLPVIHALQNAAPEEKKWIKALIERADFTDTEFHQLVHLLKTIGGIGFTHQCAAEQIDAAKKALSLFTLNPILEILYDIADYALVRKL